MHTSHLNDNFFYLNSDSNNSNNYHFCIIDKIFIKFNINAIKILLNNKVYKKNIHRLYIYNNHLYDRNIFNYNQINDSTLESSINNTISQNKIILHNLVIEKYIINIINSYENDLIFNEMIDLLNENKKIKDLFYTDSNLIFSNYFMKFYFKNYIFKQHIDIQNDFFKKFLKIKLNIELCEYLINMKEFIILCNYSHIIKELFLQSTLKYVDKMIDFIDFNIIMEQKLNDQILELFINKGNIDKEVNNNFWINVNKFQISNITETFVIKYDKYIDIKLFSQNNFLSIQFLKLYENIIDWNCLLSNNKYDKDTLKQFQYHLLYYLYSKGIDS